MNPCKVLHRFTNKHLSLLSISTVAIFCTVFQLTATVASAAVATLAWDIPTYSDGTPVSDVAGYKIHMGTSSGNLSDQINVGNVTSYTVTNLSDSTTYYFAVTDYNASGEESGFSNQVAFATPTPPTSAALYTLTASAGSGGSITPSGATVVSQGTSQTFTVTPNTGYYVVSVVVDGTPMASNIPQGGYSYTFSNVTANHTISTTFAIRNFHIVSTAGTGGSVSPGDVWVLFNTSKTVTVTPSSGYHITDVKVDGTSVGAVGSYTFNNLAADHTVSATFAVNYQNYPIRIAGSSTTYQTLQSAYDSSAAEAEIQMQAVDIVGDLTTTGDHSVLLSGGYSSDFTSKTGYTTLHGKLAISNGSLRFDRIIFR